jgi:hypothetical protein
MKSKFYLIPFVIALLSFQLSAEVPPAAGPLVFDPEFYLEMYPDVAALARGNRADFARNHWLRHGMAEGRAGSPAFHLDYYKEKNPDVWERFRRGRNPTLELVLHWLEYGIEEGRDSSPVFNVRFYLRNNSPLAREIGRTNYREAVIHFNERGVADRFPGSNQFDPVAYLRARPELQQQVGARNYYEAALHAIRAFEAKESVFAGRLPPPPPTPQPTATPTATPTPPQEERTDSLPPALQRRIQRP